MKRKLREKWATDVEKPTARCPLSKLAATHLPQRSSPASSCPLLKLTKRLEEENPDRTVAVLIPELVKQHWWEYLLHGRHAQRLRSALLEYGGSRVAVIVVPWYLSVPKIEAAMTEEELNGPFRVRGIFGSRRLRAGRKET